MWNGWHVVIRKNASNVALSLLESAIDLVGKSGILLSNSH
jgi:hypothetical protein